MRLWRLHVLLSVSLGLARPLGFSFSFPGADAVLLDMLPVGARCRGRRLDAVAIFTAFLANPGLLKAPQPVGPLPRRLNAITDSLLMKEYAREAGAEKRATSHASSY